MLHPELQGYKEQSESPVWKLLYKIKWVQLADIIDLHELKILDFGSGFGTTANFLAKNNEVIAVEPRDDIIQVRENENHYTQLHGGLDIIKKMEDNTFDVIICHNVLEFASKDDERVNIVKEFSRLLKNNGILSIIKNNGVGRIIAKVVHENNVDEAINLLKGGHIANVFGRVDLYDYNDIEKWGENLKIEKLLGVRTFYGLQQNSELQHEPGWIDNMFNIEMKTCDMEPYKSISLFHHVILRKN